MKKSLLFFVMLFSLSAFAENQNFYLNTKELNIQAEDVLSYFFSWFNLDKSISFEVIKEREDQFGAKHLTFQEYVNNVPVDKCVLLVHTKDGYVTSVNGLVMENTQKPSSCNQRFSRKSAAKQVPAKVNEDHKLVIVSIQKSDSCIYRYAYKYFSNETFTYYYIDVETGEIIREESTISCTSKSGTAYTYYQGWKNINYSNTTDGKNILLDEQRNIYTLDASALNISDLENTVYDYENPTSEWYEPVLTSVKITYAAQSWWYSITDANPDFYIKVKNSSGTVLYTSGYYSDVNVPVTFNIPGEIVAAGNLVIEIYDYDGVSDDYGGSVNVTAIEAGTYTWSGTNTKGEIVIGKHSHPALDVHWGMEKVYDFYLNKFNFKSFDGQGTQILQLVAPPAAISQIASMGFPNQACALGSLGMLYGMGDGVTMNPVVAVDVMGHEFTHMVTSANGSQNLPNYGIGGALNESYADIIGMCIKNYAVGSTDWLIGNGVMIGSTYGMRSMKDPKVAGHPNCYEGTNYHVPTGNPDASTNDMDYVHSNNGVQNFWFYLLCNGGTGTNDKGNSYNVVGIGMDKAVQIAFSSLVDYIQSNDGWFESREHTLEAAAEIYGRTSQEYQSVANAWYAVNVGNKYQAPVNSKIKAKVPSNWGNTISAWVWSSANGTWKTLTRDGDWYVYSSTDPFNIIFVNGSDWAGDNNQTVDIAVNGNLCIQIASNTTGKRSYTSVDCEDSTTDQYYIFAKRKTGDYYYLTPTSVSDKDRLVAVDAGDSVLTRINTSSAPSTYLWTIEPSGNGVLLKNGAKYLYSTAAKSAKLNTTGLILTKRSNADGTTSFVYAKSATENWYLSLANKGSDYFVFYANENQITHLVLVARSQTPTEIISPSSSSERRKVFINGQVYIIVDGKQYDLLGRQVL